MTERDLKSIVCSAKRGDTGAFTQLVELHYSMVYGVAFSTVKDPMVAEDIAQEVFFAARAGS